jgi:hypothetical protein
MRRLLAQDVEHGSGSEVELIEEASFMAGKRLATSSCARSGRHRCR